MLSAGLSGSCLSKELCQKTCYTKCTLNNWNLAVLNSVNSNARVIRTFLNFPKIFSQTYTIWGVVTGHFLFQTFYQKSREIPDELFLKLEVIKNMFYLIFRSIDFVKRPIKGTTTKRLKSNICDHSVSQKAPNSMQLLQMISYARYDVCLRF